MFTLHLWCTVRGVDKSITFEIDVPDSFNVSRLKDHIYEKLKDSANFQGVAAAELELWKVRDCI